MKRTGFLILFSGFAFMFLAVVQASLVKTSDLRLTQIAGHELYLKKNCNSCHTLTDKSEGKLTAIPNQRSAEWFKEHVTKESELVLAEAKSKRKARRVLKKELEAMNDYLFESGEAKARVAGLPANIREGAYLGYQNNCGGCHVVAGGGKEIGPDLTFIADRKGDRAWHISNLKNPQQFSPESPMPAFEGKLPDTDLEKIADYLLTLRK